MASSQFLLTDIGSFLVDEGVRSSKTAKNGETRFLGIWGGYLVVLSFRTDQTRFDGKLV